jgi:hypothetical protein
MYREKETTFRVKLKYDEIDRDTRFAFLRGDIVEVDVVGDEPEQAMGVQWLEIHGTEITLDWKDYEITEEMPTVVADTARVFRETHVESA